MSYDYMKGQEIIEKILNNPIKIVGSEKIPKNDSEFTFDNGYYNWVTAMFVDIRNSSELFSKKGLETKEETAKLIRAFTSEIIEILKDDDNLREIGIRGDCVYAIYTTPKKHDEYACADKAFYINTYLNMLNKLLSSRGKEIFKAGIGMATDQELVVKAGAAYTGINSKVWIGNAVTRASNLSALGEKETPDRLFFSELSYINFIEELQKINSEKDVEEWFKKIKGRDGETSYHADIVKVDFDKWINSEISS